MLGGEVRNYQFPVGSTAAYCPPNGQPPANSKYCNNNCCKSVSSLLSSLGICLLVVGYTLIGALTFMALEGRTNLPSEQKSSEHDHLRSQTVEKLWSITEDLNILYKDNWTRLAEQEVLKFQNLLVRKHKQLNTGQKIYNWNFPSAFLYSLTLITTIGYGNVTPRTAWGRLITIAYALVGIPLMLVYLSTVGDTLAQQFRRLYSKLPHTKSHKAKASANKNDSSVIGTKTLLQNHISPKKHEIPCLPQARERVPICLTLLIVIGYISGGAFLFNKLENWSFIEGSYFCFTSLGTIGFGELVPGTTSGNNDLSVFVSSAFILIGMAIIAMCFNLIQDEIVIILRKISLWWHKPDKIEEEDLSITVKSS
ncbi:TWiK family of potassium channels protein 7-like [Cimex lectularius]|uniref:Potassium channel domain-containing protein n=1 Tax=Cimex lectularius TaxID=79782 RepID=A0A8I6RQ39_CIMLE|nr:TWiK family of potassium channels protein 7-like [Cimex lectularius]XP_024085909.1 TWiK family of potassium channels protein 7-like [Cimex lectularius]